MEDAGRRLRIFFLEDNQDDVVLELRELEKAGFTIDSAVARSRSELIAKLPAFPADIVLADYALPDITGIEAIELCRTLGVDVPVILITGEGNEQIAVDSLRLGAIDYIIKRNIAGLPARVRRSIEIWRDRKARERAESEERRLLHLLFETQKMDAIGRLAGGIAHDFNNILTGVIGSAELCAKEVPADAPVREKLRSIVIFARKGADLVKQLLIYGKKVPLEFEMVDLHEFLPDAVRFLRRMIEQTVEIRLEVGGDLPQVRCDTRQFTQVLMNLVLNARDAMDGRGTVTIRAERGPQAEEDRGGAAPAGESVLLSVSDTGVGIAPEDIAKIFDPFYTTKLLGKGTGLGLAIVQSVVNAHGGIITVSSEKGRGTTFTVLVPCSGREGQHPAAAGAAAAAGALRPPGSRQGSETVLIVEDEEMLRKLAAATVGSLGYHVLVAKDGAEALQVCRIMPDRIDLVLSDMLMPVKGGIELFHDLRELGMKAKFILVTGYSLADQDQQTLQQMDAVMTKPYTEDALANTLRDVLDRA